jgi:hypothetical protein
VADLLQEIAAEIEARAVWTPATRAGAEAALTRGEELRRQLLLIRAEARESLAQLGLDERWARQSSHDAAPSTFALHG